MVLYVLKIGSNNDFCKVMSETMKARIQKYNACVLMPDFREIDTTLMSLTFENEKDRENFANEIPDIAFTYETMEYPNELWEKAKNGKGIDCVPNSYCENKIEKILNKLKIEYTKDRKTTSKYNFTINGVEWLIILGLNDKFVTGVFQNGILYTCYDEILVKKCVKDMLKEIKKQAKNWRNVE